MEKQTKTLIDENGKEYTKVQMYRPGDRTFHPMNTVDVFVPNNQLYSFNSLVNEHVKLLADKKAEEAIKEKLYELFNKFLFKK